MTIVEKGDAAAPNISVRSGHLPMKLSRHEDNVGRIIGLIKLPRANDPVN